MREGDTYVYSDTFGLLYLREKKAPGILTHTRRYSHIVKLLNAWLAKVLPAGPVAYTTLTLNVDYSGCVHRDPNDGPTFMA
eukprot:4651471-Prorocentrum_lima.AAC.1